MKNSKGRAKGTTSELELLRSGSAYQGARSFLGIPFIIFGCLFFAGAAVSLVTMGILAALVQVICGLFCLGIVALAGALFDLADCALRAETRDKAREARDAYDAYRRQQGEVA
jgi:hypothetical protein